MTCTPLDVEALNRGCVSGPFMVDSLPSHGVPALNVNDRVVAEHDVEDGGGRGFPPRPDAHLRTVIAHPNTWRGCGKGVQLPR